jgi:hypothetical protein
MVMLFTSWPYTHEVDGEGVGETDGDAVAVVVGDGDAERVADGVVVGVVVGVREGMGHRFDVAADSVYAAPAASVDE